MHPLKGARGVVHVDDPLQDDPDGKMIQILFLLFSSSTQGPRPQPLFFTFYFGHAEAVWRQCRWGGLALHPYQHSIVGHVGCIPQQDGYTYRKSRASYQTGFEAGAKASASMGFRIVALT